jgi:hypothetical protein
MAEETIGVTAGNEQAEATQRETERVARETQDALEKAAREAKHHLNPRNWF